MKEAHYPYVSYVEMGSKDHGFKGAVIRKIGDETAKQCRAVVLMINPITFKNARGDVRVHEEDSRGTLRAVMRVFDGLLNNGCYVRIYNSTTIATKDRVELLKKHPKASLFPEDQEITDAERQTNWWVAWGSNSDYPEDAKLRDLQSALLKTRWEKCVAGKTQGQLAGFERVILATDDYHVMNPHGVGSMPCAAWAFDCYLHPCLVKNAPGGGTDLINDIKGLL